MPEDIPKAVMILLWLLIGTITFGYILMRYDWLPSIGFAVVWYGIPAWLYRRYQAQSKQSDDTAE